MAVGTIQRSVLTDIANAIRVQNGGTGTYLPSEMAAAVLTLDGTKAGTPFQATPGAGASVISDAVFDGIADAIRAQNGLSETYKPSEMAPAILALAWDVGAEMRAILLADDTLEFQLPRRALLRRARRGDPGRLGGGPGGLLLGGCPPMGRREALRDARRLRRRLLRGRARQRELPLPRVREPRGGVGLRGALGSDQPEPDVRELPLARDDLDGRVHLVRHERVAHVQRVQQARGRPGLRAGADGQPREAQLRGGRCADRPRRRPARVVPLLPLRGRRARADGRDRARGGAGARLVGAPVRERPVQLGGLPAVVRPPARRGGGGDRRRHGDLRPREHELLVLRARGGSQA